MHRVGDLKIECASCGMHLLIPIEAALSADENGRYYIDTSADTSGLWLHAWADHEGEIDGGH